MKYFGLIINIPTFFIFIFSGIAMLKSDIDINPVFGYRTKASRSSKEAWDFANKNFGKFLVLVSIFSFVLSLILTFFIKSTYPVLTSLIPIFLLMLLLILGILKTESDLHKKFNLEKKSSKTLTVTTLIVLVSILIVFTIACTSIPHKPYNLSVNQNILSIDGWGSANIDLNSVSKIKLLTSAPNVEWNSGGGALNNKIFGVEHLNIYGNTHCFVENSNKHVIFIKTPEGQYLIGLDDDNKTVNLFKFLEDKLKL